MPFSCNSRMNIGEREGHLKTTLKKLVFFTSMWRDVLNRRMDSHPPVGLNPASSHNMSIITGRTACLNTYVLPTKQHSAAHSKQNWGLQVNFSTFSLTHMVQRSVFVYCLEGKQTQTENSLQNFPSTIQTRKFFCHAISCCFSRGQNGAYGILQRQSVSGTPHKPTA